MVSANFSGNFEPGQGIIKIQAEKTNAAITKGDVCSISSNKWVRATTSATGPFAVCLKDAAASDTTVSLALAGVGYVVADGTINPNSAIVVSASTAGQVQASATPSVDGVVGQYLAHENEGDGETVPTAAADGDVIRIRLGGPY